MSPKPDDQGRDPSNPQVELGTSATIIPKSPPPPPVPSTDPLLATQQPPKPGFGPFVPPSLMTQPDDIFKVKPLAALKLLGEGVEALVRLTGDVPPTPPSTKVHVSHMKGMVAEKDNIVRKYSSDSLRRLREQALRQEGRSSSPLATTVVSASQDASATQAPAAMPGQAPSKSLPLRTRSQQTRRESTPAPEIDGVQLKTPTPTRETPDGTSTWFPTVASPPVPEPYVVIGSDSQPLNEQHSAITRKFYSKRPPPIGISDYLLRIHHFCPMSTAVYLATSIYIHRLAVDERAIAVTKRNVHRLLLAGLRVAMKALEDLSYPHNKVAKVGGVSELELARLEISFCFLCGFELVVGLQQMTGHWMTMKQGLSDVGGDGGLPVAMALGLPRRTSIVAQE